MNRTLARVTVPLLFLFPSIPLAAQQQQTPQNPAEEVMTPAEFTNFLKQVWSFVKDQTDGYLTSIAKKEEFETAREFERRLADTRQQYVSTLIKYSRDNKLDQRSFAVLFKAELGTYDADKQLYMISSVTVVDAPYNIPTVLTTIRKNPYVYLADSIRAGYRTSSLYIKLPKGNRWQVGRDLARSAKAEEENIFFRAKLMIDIENPNLKEQRAVLELIPRELAFVNHATSKVFWSVPIR
jgi:hypothetical protein